MSETLFPYQNEGISFLANKRYALLADEMGLGKTVQAIKAADEIKAQTILVVCPAVARVNWSREFDMWSGMHRSSRYIAIYSYEYVTKNAEELSKNKWDLLIVDEAHYLKNPKASRTKALLGKTGIVRSCKTTWFLSGTPAPNNAAELWPLLYTFGVTKLKYDEFLTTYCNWFITPYGKQITGSKINKIPELKKLLEPIMLRRKKDEVMTQLPPISFQDLTVEPGHVDISVEGAFADYVFPEDRRKELMSLIEKEKQLVSTVVNDIGTNQEGMKILMAMAKSVATLRRYIGLQKLEPVAELVAQELESNAYDKIVIFAIHRDVIEGLRIRLRKYNPVNLYGGTPPQKRQKFIDKFQTNPKCRVFIGNITAAGTAITLTAAHNVLFIEQDWVPGNNAQAAMRCHRIGQTKPVFVRFVGLADSMDAKISHILKRKAKELSQIFDDDLVKSEDSILPGANPDGTSLDILFT